MDANEFTYILGQVNGKLEALSRIEKHLETLNSKTATNTADIATLKMKVGVMQWFGATSVVTVLGGLAKRYLG
jgi:hypothetical protein